MKKKIADMTVEEVYESMDEQVIDMALECLDTLDDPDDSDNEDERSVEGKLDVDKLYESMDASWEDAILRGISGETGGHDYYGGKGLGDVEPEVPAKGRRKTSRPKPKRKPKRKR